MAMESGNIARARWHMATSRIIDLLHKGKRQSLVEKMKKNMNNSMLASLAAVNPDTCPENKMKPTNPNADTFLEGERQYLSHFLLDIVVGHPDMTH